MKITRSVDGRLLITQSATGLRTVGLAFVAVFVYALFEPPQGQHWWPGGAVGLLLGIAIILISDESRFEFDALRREITWRRGNLVKRESGVIAFADVEAVAFITTGYDGGEPSKRLAIVTRGGPVRLTNRTGEMSRVERAACAEIQRVIGDIPVRG
jgi:hypothetical protein